MPQFSQNDIRRIAAAVGRVEGTPYLDENTAEALHKIDPATVLMRRFELKDDLTKNDTPVDAYLLTRDPISTVQPGPLRIRKHLIFKLMSFTDWTGTGRDAGPPVVDGTRGLCVHLPDTNRWEVISGDSGLKVATLDATLSYNGTCDATITKGGSGTVTAHDVLLMSGESLDSGTKVILAMIDGDECVIDASCATS